MTHLGPPNSKRRRQLRSDLRDPNEDDATGMVVSQPPSTFCGAKLRKQNRLCQHAAGYGTDHPGKGRCKYHGGCSLVKHGRYSSIKSQRLHEYFAALEEDRDPLDLLPDVIALRALFLDFMNRCEEERPGQSLDLINAHTLLAEAGRMVERIERIRAANAISRPELTRIYHEMWRAVEAQINDDDVKAHIRDAWLAISL